MEYKTTPTNSYVRIRGDVDKIPEFDPRSGNHFWAMFGVWSINPEEVVEGVEGILDHENLVNVQGPACYFCEKTYTPLLAERRCIPAK